MKFSVGIKSLLLQLSSLLSTFILLSIASSVFKIYFSVFELLFFHACLAAFAAFILKFDWWWWLIQFSFPLLAYFLSAFNISPYVYFLVLIIFSALFWSTYRTQVPYYPSRSQLLEPILELIVHQKNLKLVDIGSGMGGLLINLSARRIDGEFFGVEIAPLPWLVSVVRSVLAKSKVRFKFGDFYRLNFSDFDVVFCYLSPAAMPSVWEKVKTEMRPGTLFLSYEFIVPNITPDISMEIDVDGGYLYGWRI
ncbi:class I SAM-dependent methyltransferase [Undibacterium flavidum]|uniref:Class I SAM-dependent methyltransferase n=1 Tax=Undibacterium flavidum TaxID=2762297 RepID=A0ABR6YEK6_9BURK|nr:class I SAM-dependent methyltransferase [Undibacterium flavidum]MBC3874976.1 class I SAM-dependent methyltransferase [Undibacterium flavidum]